MSLLSASAPLPDPELVWKAIDTYLGLAYAGGDQPLAVQTALAALDASAVPFYENPALVPDLHKPPTRYSLRLGNRHYPHMKLSLELSPDDSVWLFRVDAHDKHACPSPKAPEYSAFCQLMMENQELVGRIESAWAEQGLATFKTYLRDDLARRQGIL
jgi:hypothetical protein